METNEMETNDLKIERVAFISFGPALSWIHHIVTATGGKAYNLNCEIGREITRAEICALFAPYGAILGGGKRE